MLRCGGLPGMRLTAPPNMAYWAWCAVWPWTTAHTAFVQTWCARGSSRHMMDSLFAEAEDPVAEMQAYAKEVPLGRFALPSEVAKAIFHLASDEASYTNGALYSIDGGATAGHFG
ncbi:SDR family oxidoreductase [Pseudomonas mediterranea]|uniref:SDR family oxidoreductase n=1 Tax=Pseudomonas mediterranea TaxID=183795 RepID=UPI003B977000